jgi:hypothetical protein
MCLVGKGLLLGYIETVAQAGDPAFGFVNSKPPPSIKARPTGTGSGTGGGTGTAGASPGSGDGILATPKGSHSFMKGGGGVGAGSGGGVGSLAEQSAVLGAREPREAGVPGFPVWSPKGCWLGSECPLPPPHPPPLPPISKCAAPLFATSPL